MMVLGKTGVATTRTPWHGESLPAPQMFAEVFPIRTDALPPLTAYRVHAREDASNARRVPARLAERLSEYFAGTWVRVGGHILTDQPPNPVKLLIALDDIRAEQPSQWRALDGLEEDFGWHPTPEQVADFVVRGAIARLEDLILDSLAKTAFSIKNVRTQREYRVRTWAVDGAPALSISVVSRLLYEPDLQAYAESLSKPTDMIGMWVADKTSRLQGEVVKVVGILDEQRARLLELTERPVMRQLITDAPGDHWVVRVLSGAREYDYVTDALDLVIRLRDVSQFQINQTQVERALHLKPALHTQMVKIVSDVLKDHNLIDSAFSAQNTPRLFANLASRINLVFSGGRARPYEPSRLPLDFAASGALKLPERFATEPLRVVIINTLSADVGDFMEALRRTLERDFHIKLEIVRERNMRVISGTNLESAVRLLIKEPHDLALAFLPDEIATPDEDEGVDDRNTRLQTIGRGMPCLIIHESTLHEPDHMNQVIMGILSRAGGVPYLLDEPLSYADRVVGLSLIEQRKKDVDYLTGTVRVYRKDGSFVCYVIATEPLSDSDGIPEALLARLFPASLFRGKRVVIHCDGKMRREALRALGSWEGEIDATFYPVEIIRQGVPNLYAFNAGRIEPPVWGSIFRLSDTEAFVTTANVGAVIQPLHIRTEPSLPLEQAIDSVLRFTLLHYGAIKPSKAPVTVYGSDAIEAGILRGVLDQDAEGTIPFWL